MREDKKDTGTKYDKSMVNRLARASGHLKSIRGMVEQGRDCSEGLIQLAAVRSAVNGAGKEVLKQYMDECIEEALEKGDEKSLERLNKALDSFLK